MRPKLITPKNILLLLIGMGIFAGLVYWGQAGFPLPGAGIPSTAGKIVFVSDRDGQTDLYMTDLSGEKVERLTNDPAIEGEPTFSADGAHLAFTADRGNSGVRQVNLMEAAPGRRVVTLTTTSSTKEHPQIGDDRSIFFLDSGKVAKTSFNATDAEALFPDVEAKRDNGGLRTLFAEGGIATASVAPNGRRVAAVVKRERGQVLVISEEVEGGGGGGEHGHGAAQTAMLGAGEKVLCQYQPDGSLIALFVSGNPLPKPVLLPNDTNSDALGVMEQYMSSLADVIDGMAGKSMLVRFDPDLKVTMTFPMPITVDGFQIAPDQQQMAFYISEQRTGQPPVGLLVKSLTTEEPPHVISDAFVESVSWSPDSKLLVFASNKGIYTAPSSGEEQPKSLTKGKGNCSAPIFSPAKSAK